MSYAAKGATRGRSRLRCGSQRPAALGLVRGHPRHYAQLSCRRNLTHRLDFSSPWRYNGANVRMLKTVRSSRASNQSAVEQGAVLFAVGWEGSGDHLDQQLKDLMKELGEAINESLSDSEQIAEVVSRIKEGGYDIFLVLEATIGVSKQGEKSPDKASLVTTLSTNPEFKVNDQDVKFLKSLRIKIEEEK